MCVCVCVCVSTEKKRGADFCFFLCSVLDVYRVVLGFVDLNVLVASRSIFSGTFIDKIQRWTKKKKTLESFKKILRKFFFSFNVIDRSRLGSSAVIDISCYCFFLFDLVRRWKLFRKTKMMSFLIDSWGSISFASHNHAESCPISLSFHFSLPSMIAAKMIPALGCNQSANQRINVGSISYRSIEMRNSIRSYRSN